MQPVRKAINMGGVTVNLLVTPAVYGIARRKGLDLSISKESSMPEVMDTYCRMAYCAAVLANEIERVDDPEIPVLVVKFSDVEEWRAQHPDEFMELVQFMYSALSQRPYSELVLETIKKKKKPGMLNR